MAGPRKSTIAKKLGEVIVVLQNDKRSAEKRVESALKRVEKLAEKLEGSETKRAPSAYAKFVKAEFGKMKKANPTLDAPGIMKKLSVKWNDSKKPAAAKKGSKRA